MRDTASRPLQTVAVVLAVTALIPVAYVWAEFAHRVLLFYTEYHSQPYLNHVGDGYFSSMPRAARIGAVVAVAAVGVAVWCRRWLLVAISIIAVIAGFAAPPFLAYLHAHHMLVSYSEFAAHEFHQSP